MARILIVDDDALVLASVQMLLVHAGHEVLAVDQARKAVIALEREPFDLVIVDVFMPGMDGYQAIKEFQRLDPGVPIIAMSGVMFRESSKRRKRRRSLAGSFPRSLSHIRSAACSRASSSRSRTSGSCRGFSARSKRSTTRSRAIA